MCYNNIMKQILFLSVFLLTSCEQNIIYRGTKVDKDDFNFIKSKSNKQTLSKSHVIDKIGYPSIVLSDNHWIYIYQEVKKQSFLVPKILFSEAVIVTFNNNNILYKISRQSLNTDINKHLEKDTTKINDQDLTFLKQMYHNMYKIGQKQ